MCVKKEKHKKLKSREKEISQKTILFPFIECRHIHRHTHTHTHKLKLSPSFVSPIEWVT